MAACADSFLSVCRFNNGVQFHRNRVSVPFLQETPLIDRIARSTAELSDTTLKVTKERIYPRLSFVLQKWNRRPKSRWTRMGSSDLS